jgi:hypothetical protein
MPLGGWGGGGSFSGRGYKQLGLALPFFAPSGQCVKQTARTSRAAGEADTAISPWIYCTPATYLQSHHIA